MLCTISIDIDDLPHYHDIHALAPPAPQGPAAAQAAPIYEVALPRAQAFANAHNFPLTLFAVGQDLIKRPESADLLRHLATRGHAVENHSYSHRYDLTRLPPQTILEDIAQGIQAITEATGHRPTGFRAPGYTVNDTLFDALEDLDVTYDSSVFPCPPYYLAKAAAMTAIRLRRRPSRSILDTPRVLTAPRRPYHPSAQAWYRPPAPGARARRFLELPIQVTPTLRLPFIGTLLALAGETVAAALARSLVGETLINLELHAIDFLDASEGAEALLPHQPELRVPVARRLDALAAAIAVFARAGYAFVRLDEAAQSIAPSREARGA